MAAQAPRAVTAPARIIGAPMHARRSWLRSLFLSLACAGGLSAQDGTVIVTARFEPPVAKPGDTVTLVVSARTSPGWHAYGARETTQQPVALPAEKLVLDGLEPVGAAEIPPGSAKPGPLGVQYPLPPAFEVKQALRVPAGSPAREITVAGMLKHQICDPTMCLPPSETPFTAALRIEAAGAAAPPLGTKPGLRLLPDEKLVVAAKFTPATARAGEIVDLVLTATVADGYHAYGTKEQTNMPVALDPAKVDAGGLEPIGVAIVPPGEPKAAFGIETFPLPQLFDVVQRYRVPAGTAPGELTVDGVLDYQVCDENSCDPATEAEFQAKLVVEAGAARAERVEVAPPPAPAGGSSPFGGSWLALILACIGGGLFALAMPCTYPMIPITFSFFTKQAEKRGGNVTGLALTYGLGIVVMFVLVGVALSSVIIDVVNHWVTNTVIGVLFVFFAFVLFGWVNLNPPQFLQRAAGRASATGGYLGIFFMGATLVITSFTCTAPIVGSLIANVAQFGTLRVGIGMAVFGLTMALPFVVLSLMPTKVKSMPRSGEWMETLKVSLGFVELAAALKFLSMVDFALGWQILPRELFLLLWTAIFGMWAMYLFGILRKAGTVNEGVGAGRMASGMAVTLLATYFFFGALGNKLDAVMTGFVPGYSNSLLSTTTSGKAPRKYAGEHVIVADDRARAIEVARAEDKLLLYNFTGFN